MKKSKANSSGNNRKPKRLATRTYLRRGVYYYVEPKTEQWIRLDADPAIALAKLAQLRSTAVVAKAKGTTVADMLTDFIDTKAARAVDYYGRPDKRPNGVLSRQTISDYRKAIDFLNRSIGHIELSDLSRDDILNFQDLGSSAGHGLTQLDRRLATLSAAITWAQQAPQWRGHAPMFNPVHNFKRLGSGSREVYPYDEHVVSVLTDTELNNQLRLYLQMLLLTGQRQQDVIDLTFGDIKVNHINGQAVSYLELHRKKTRGGQPLRLQIGSELQTLINDSKNDGTQSHFICHTRTGAQLKYENVQSQWQRFRKKRRLAGEPIKFTLHDLRAKVATDLINEGADPAAVQALMGHSSLATTQIYFRKAKSAFSNAINLRGGYVAPQKQQVSAGQVKSKK